MKEGSEGERMCVGECVSVMGAKMIDGEGRPKWAGYVMPRREEQTRGRIRIRHTYTLGFIVGKIDES